MSNSALIHRYYETCSVFGNTALGAVKHSINSTEGRVHANRILYGVLTPSNWETIAEHAGQMKVAWQLRSEYDRQLFFVQRPQRQGVGNLLCVCVCVSHCQNQLISVERNTITYKSRNSAQLGNAAPSNLVAPTPLNSN